MTKLDLYSQTPGVHIVTGACPHDCPDTCAWQIAVDARTGKALDIWGHSDHPITQGFLCTKVDRYLERSSHVDRLLYPMRRRGPKGSGQFERISWDAALDEIAARLQQVVEKWGPEAILPYSYAGTMGFIQGDGVAQRLWNRLGVSRLARTICSEAGFQGYKYTMGATIGMEPESFAASRFILIWGSNTLTSNVHLWPFIQEARKQGARVVVIDPVRTRTASAADEWIALRPGTDAALALGLMHVIFAEGLEDAEYIARYCVGGEALRERAAQWHPARVADITAVPAERIVQLAREYATLRPASIRVNYGLQRHRGGGMAMRTITCLPALVGAWREWGGGVQLSTSGAFGFDKSTLTRPDLLPPGAAPRTINMIRLGDALSLDPARRLRSLYRPRPVDPLPTLAEADPPVMVLVVYNTNPAAVNPDQESVRVGLRREDLFTIVLEHFQTDTADYADILLPATTQIEHWDLNKPYGHYYLQLNKPAIAPVGESLPNSEIFRRIAQRLGFQEAAFQQTDPEIIQEFLAAQTHPVFQGITFERLEQEGFARLNLPTPFLPFAEGNFPTPSGKCELYSENMAADGYDPLPNYTPPHVDELYTAWRRRANATNRKVTAHDNGQAISAVDTHSSGRDKSGHAHPLVCISPPNHYFLNSSFVNVPHLLRRAGEPIVIIHPEDAAQRGITHGERVRVFNERGAFEVKAVVTDGIVPGTVMAPGVWWCKLSPDGRNVNYVTPPDETDMGAAATFYDVLVQVAPVAANKTKLQERYEVEKSNVLE